ncbi:hypothetical protein GGI02_005611, partial [Coemansia sp. RSA 2322]
MPSPRVEAAVEPRRARPNTPLASPGSVAVELLLVTPPLTPAAVDDDDRVKSRFPFVPKNRRTEVSADPRVRDRLNDDFSDSVKPCCAASFSNWAGFIMVARLLAADHSRSSTAFGRTIGTDWRRGPAAGCSFSLPESTLVDIVRMRPLAVVTPTGNADGFSAVASVGCCRRGRSARIFKPSVLST